GPGAGAGAVDGTLRPIAIAAGRPGIRHRARYHRRARPRLPAGDDGLRRRQLRTARRAEHPRAGGVRKAGAVRAADGELCRQRAGPGRARRPPSARSGCAVAADARSARAPRRDPQARRAGARGGFVGAGRERAGCAADRGAAAVSFWWVERPPLWTLPLAPLELAYRAGAAVHRASVRQVRARVPVISVGNLTAGGAGKTPVAIHIGLRLAARGLRPAILSRGYGRRTRASMQVSPQSLVAEVGDEPLLMARRGLTVFVGPRRALLAELAAQRGADVLILDD